MVLPNIIQVGLLAIPYIDPNPKGNGYYTLKERPIALTVFGVGFLLMWVSLIIIGTFLRGPGWMWFWPGEKWDPNRVEATKNIDLTEWLFPNWEAMKSAPYGNGLELSSLTGAAIFVGYTALSVIIPYIWLKKKHPEFLEKWGIERFVTTAVLGGWMIGTILKVGLRLGLNIKYIWVTPWFNV